MLGTVTSEVNRIKAILSRPFGASQKAHQLGMTLIEILIVIALLAGLMGILATKVFDISDSAKEDQARLAMGKIGESLNYYRAHNNRYPSAYLYLNEF